ncbi:MAG TPA: hypothetical protein DCX06_04110 [Opitutae bacterium]|nr:hypothetical protein [Opitutae bacterium]
MKFEYQIIKEHQLIIEVVSGQITLEGLADKTCALFADPDYDASYVGLADYRHASPQITRTELYGFAKFLNENDLFGQSKWAIIADNPMVVALTQIFQQRMLDTDLIGVFSTTEAAAAFLERPVLLDYVHDYPVI